MDRITDAFAWPFRDPDWVSKIAIIGLILLVPVLGGMNGLGWMLAALDRLRAGDERLPPASFNHLGRGFPLFVVTAVYYLLLLLVGALLYVPATVILATEGRDSSSAVLVAVGISLLILTFSVVSLGSLALTFAAPSIVLAVSRGGISGGLRADAIWRMARSSLVNTLIAGLMLIAAHFVASLGLMLCCIGVVFTNAYALAMEAWIVRSFEIGSPPAIKAT